MGCRIVLWLLAVAVVLVGCRSRASGVFRVVVAVRLVTVTARKVWINKAGAVTVMVVVAVGLRWLVERRVMPVRLVRAPTVVADRLVRVLVAVAVTVGMAVAAVVVRRMAALVAVVGLVT